MEKIWRVDLGYLGKIRPVVVLSVPYLEHERALHIVMAHTTSLRATRFEVSVPHAALQPGAFDAQQIFLLPPAKFERCLGVLDAAAMTRIDQAVAFVLGLRV